MTDRTAAEQAAEALQAALPYLHGGSDEIRMVREALAALTAEARGATDAEIEQAYRVGSKVGAIKAAAEHAARVSPDREALARRLFEHVFQKLQPRLDGKHTWEAADEVTRQGFRDEIDVIFALHLPVQAEAATLKRRLDYRFNEHLCEMKPDYDDSITGFNEAWKVVDDFFASLPPAVGEWRPIATERVEMPPALIEKLRTRYLPDLLTLTKVDDDIWISPGPIALHTDGTTEGLVTYGVVLVNDGDYLLLYDGRTYGFPVGSIYRIDGRKPHGVIDAKDRIGRFAFLAWDMPSDYSTGRFASEVRARLPAPPQETKL